MKPHLSIAVAAADLNPTDLTAKTGGVAGDNNLAGYSGAAWFVRDTYLRRKLQNGLQLDLVGFNDSGSPVTEGGYTSYNNPATVQSADWVLQAPGANGFGIVQGYGIPQVNAGLKFFFDAGIDHRHCEVVTEAFGGFVARVSVDDASTPPKTVTLPPSGLTRIVINVGAASYGGKCRFEIRRVDNSGDYLRPLYGWVGVPLVAQRPKGAILSVLAKLGGANR